MVVLVVASLVAGAIKDSGLEPAGSLDVLDAGCGTGLCGPLVKPYARSLVGVALFSILRRFGQIDLVINIAYVILLGSIGLMMLAESTRALRRVRRALS